MKVGNTEKAVGRRRTKGGGRGWGEGDDADMRRDGRRDGGGRISERYSSCLHSLPPSLHHSFIHLISCLQVAA